jgi:hypothetical protein
VGVAGPSFEAGSEGFASFPFGGRASLPSDIHSASSTRRFPAKEEPMRDDVYLPTEPGEVASEIASILAQGYLRCRKSRPLDTSPGENRSHVAQVEKSEAFTEKRLDSSGHRSLHSQAG